MLVGSGAGGSVAAALLRDRGASFAWFEAGGDESDKLTEYPAVDVRSYPEDMWTPTDLRTDEGRPLPYRIPRTAGGQTSHYMGVSYWTRRDTRESLQMLAHETDALEFVVNRTLVAGRTRCDAMDARYHTHSRHAEEPAPDEEDGDERRVFSFPMCMYGRCNATSCRLNDVMAAMVGIVDAETNWFRGSSYLEYGGSGIRLHHTVLGLKLDTARRVLGVYVRGPTTATPALVCASRSVLLAAGVMGNARILPEGSYPFFAQPVVVYTDTAVLTGQASCDVGSVGGGTLHHPRFLSTFAACTVNGSKRLIYATPQAINPLTSGRVRRTTDGTYVATVNYDDPSIYETLWSDLEDAARSVLGVEGFVRPQQTRVQYASYHWTGDESVVHRSRHRSYDNLFIADAMAVVGTTSGWTSFNARVAGALAALRALTEGPSHSCTTTRVLFETHCCRDDVRYRTTCESMRASYQSRACCDAEDDGADGDGVVA